MPLTASGYDFRVSYNYTPCFQTFAGDICRGIVVGISLEDEAFKKFAKNKARTWGQPDAHGVVEHIR